ncbi:MAG: DEAD/DEAH box helicase [Desulfobacterales bacterium]|nr:DEAD/DEAH box helicase [Desulfobacterales bacterium]
MNFIDLGLNNKILKSLEEMGFEKPTLIQEQVIPHILKSKKDIVGLAQTGTGKTAAFGLPILEQININKKNIQSLILCPTRELCLQITNDIKNFSRYMPNISVEPVYGGAGIENQIKAIRKTQLVVATPGRLLDLIKRKAADISSIQYLVLDEADIMLNMGFKEELDAILATAPKNRQTLLFSATMPDEVAQIASNYMKDPVEIIAGRKNSGAENIEHLYFMVSARDKYLALKRIVDYYPEIYGIIFCRTRAGTQEIADKMIKDGYNAESLHGDLSQVQREYVMRKFREKNLQILVATDIAARGLDVKDLTHVINYDIPDESEVYTHRSGRTGRIGKTGISITIINMKEKYKIKQIERTVKKKLTETKVPNGRDICAQQLLHQIDRVKTVKIDNDQIVPYMPIIQEKLASLDRDELLKHFVSLEFNHFLDYYKNTPDLTPVKHEIKKEVEYKNKKKGIREWGQASFSYLIINLGKKDKMLPTRIIGIINQCTRNRNIKLGNIDINDDTSRIQVENSFVGEVCNALIGYKFGSKKIKVKMEEQTMGKN